MTISVSRLAAAAVLAVFGAIAAPASATTVSGTLTVDNSFDLYVSTDDSQLGTLVASGNDWQTNQSFSANLSGGTQYLHIVAHNDDVWGGFLGDFALSDAGYFFSNNGQSLSTDLVNWDMRINGFGDVSAAMTSGGLNGASPWGVRAGISAGAEWILDAADCANCTRYFSTEITAAVPEPESNAMMLAGLLALGGLARRQRRQGTRAD